MRSFCLSFLSLFVLLDSLFFFDDLSVSLMGLVDCCFMLCTHTHTRTQIGKQPHEGALAANANPSLSAVSISPFAAPKVISSSSSPATSTSPPPPPLLSSASMASLPSYDSHLLQNVKQRKQSAGREKTVSDQRRPNAGGLTNSRSSPNLGFIARSPSSGSISPSPTTPSALSTAAVSLRNRTSASLQNNNNNNISQFDRRALTPTSLIHHITQAWKQNVPDNGDVEDVSFTGVIPYQKQNQQQHHQETMSSPLFLDPDSSTLMTKSIPVEAQTMPTSTSIAAASSPGLLPVFVPPSAMVPASDLQFSVSTSLISSSHDQPLPSLQPAVTSAISSSSALSDSTANTDLSLSLSALLPNPRTLLYSVLHSGLGPANVRLSGEMAED